MSQQIQLRNDTAANWTLYNPILALGEFGLERDTFQFKIGNGVNHWNDLPYGGIMGETGPIGPQGETGAVIVSGAFVGNDLVFTLSDASTASVIDAKTDLTGPQGPAGPEGPAPGILDGGKANSTYGGITTLSGGGAQTI